MLERVGRIVGRAESAHLTLHEEPAAGVRGFGEGLEPLFPDSVGGLGGEEAVEVEVAGQLEVSPVIERVAEAVRHGLGPGVELVARRGRSGDALFRDAVGPHPAPFVVVAGKPDVVEVFEDPVGRDLVGREVVVEIEDGLVLREMMVELACRRRLQHEIVVNEGGGHDGGIVAKDGARAKGKARPAGAGVAKRAEINSAIRNYPDGFPGWRDPRQASANGARRARVQFGPDRPPKPVQASDFP